jgi:hypothetical protein
VVGTALAPETAIGAVGGLYVDGPPTERWSGLMGERGQQMG